MIKEYILFSRSEEEDLVSLKNKLIQQVPNFIGATIINLIYKKRIVASSWLESFKLGHFGKEAVVYDCYVQIETKDLTEAEQVAHAAFWNGFLLGRESKRRLYNKYSF
jgi:hypothetical protein